MAEATQAELSAERLVAEYAEYKQRQARSRSMAMSNWLTELAHPCVAHSVYNRTVRPEDRRETPERLAMIFSEGHEQERIFERDLLDMGYKVEGGQGQLVWPEYEIVARRDFTIQRNGSRRRRVEFKSTSPWVFDKLRAIPDLREARSPYIRRWDRQVCGLMVLEGRPDYWLVLKNKATGEIRVIEYQLGDEELRIAEELIRKAERVNELVRIGQVPIDAKLADPEVCSECEFLTVCLPPLTFGPGAKIIDDAELAAKLERREELRAKSREYEELDEEVKAHFRAVCADGATQAVCGDFVAKIQRVAVPPKTIERKGYTQEKVSIARVARSD